jgi:hypothetical protein
MTHDPEISLGLVAILEHPNEEDFAKLVELSGLDPKVAFRGANLTDVDFGFADLSNYDFSGADLTGAKIRRARGTRQLKFDSDTIWPEDWHPDVPRYDYNEARRMILSGRPPPQEWLSFIKVLDLSGQEEFSDLTPIAGLTGLQKLDLSCTRVSDLTVLAGLLKLRHLNLSVTKVRDISPLAGLIALENLELVRTQVRDIDPLANLVALRALDLWGTQVTRLSCLSGLPLLCYLDIRCSSVKDVASLYKIPKLEIDQ